MDNQFNQPQAKTAFDTSHNEPINILLVDDDEDDFILVREYLTNAGDGRYHIDWINNYQEAKQKFAGNQYDVYLVDYLLGPESGLELLQYAVKKGITTPIILLTGQGGYNVDMQAMRGGAADYLVKGEITPALLDRSIRYAIERKSSEDRLRNAEHKLRLIAENTADVICAYDMDRQLMFINPAVERLSGYTIDEFREKNFIPWFHEEDESRMVQLWENIYQSNESIEEEFRLITKEGKIKYCLSTWGPFFDESGQKTGVQLVFRDITRLKLAEKDAIRRLHFTEALNEIDRAIMSSLDLRVTLQVALEQIRTQLGVDAVDVLQLEPFTHLLKYLTGNGFLNSTVQNTVIRFGEGLAGQAALDRRLLNVPSLVVQDDPVRSALIRDEKFLHYIVVPLIAKGEVKGVLELFHRERLNPTSEWLSFLTMLAGQVAIAIENSEMFNQIQQSSMELILAYDTTLEGWSQALDLRDQDTEGHTRRVTELTLNLARQMGISSSELIHIRRGALLHDIGKMGIPDNILHKPGPLTDEEWEVMRQHPSTAYDLLSPISYLRPALDIPYSHHEKWDGTGYPQGMSRDEIPLSARIFAIIDVWDALTNDRPYRKAWPQGKALEYIQSQSGHHFDPDVTNTFLRMVH